MHGWRIGTFCFGPLRGYLRSLQATRRGVCGRKEEERWGGLVQDMLSVKWPCLTGRQKGLEPSAHLAGLQLWASLEFTCGSVRHIPGCAAQSLRKHLKKKSVVY